MTIWATVIPNRIAYRRYTTSATATAKLTHDETGTWKNITSNVAEHPTIDMIVFGVNRTNYGGAKFRKASNMNNIGDINLYESYTVNEFVPGQNQVLIYYPRGEICFLNFVPPGSFSVTQGSCHPMIDLDITMIFAGSKFIAVRESMVAVYNFPSFSFSHVYSE
jgi:hypothetical protein